MKRREWLKQGKKLILLTGVAVMVLSACTGKRYRLDLGNSGLKSRRKSYAAGAEVTVYFDLFATDTDYYFNCDSDDVILTRSYDDRHGYVLQFTMPAHDVKLSVSHRNSMESDYKPRDTSEEEPPFEEEEEEDVQGEPWFCPECGRKNTGSKCLDCGAERPADQGSEDHNE